MRRQCRGQPPLKKVQARSAWRDAETKARNSLSSSSVSNASQRSSSAELIGCAPGVCRISFSSGSRSSSARSCSCSALVLVATTSVIAWYQCRTRSDGPGAPYLTLSRQQVRSGFCSGHAQRCASRNACWPSDRGYARCKRPPIRSGWRRAHTFCLALRPGYPLARGDTWMRAHAAICCWAGRLAARNLKGTPPRAVRMLWAVAWGQGQAAGVGEAEAGVAGGAFGQGSGEYAGGGVVVVVDLGGGLARVGAQDPSGVLDEASLERDRGREEQGVQRGAVEAFPGIGPGGDDKQRRRAGPGLQAGKGGGTGFGAHPAAENYRVVPAVPQGVGDPVEMPGPLGQHQAVSAPV